MNLIEKKIYKINPSYLAEFEEFIKIHSQFGGGSKDDKFVQGRAFSNVYELYIYSYFIGLYNNLKLDVLMEDKTKTFWEIENWKPRELVKYMISCAIASSDFDMLFIENCEDDEITSEVSKLKSHIESYANGGLRFLRQKFDDDPELIDDEMFFITLLNTN